MVTIIHCLERGPKSRVLIENRAEYISSIPGPHASVSDGIDHMQL